MSQQPTEHTGTDEIEVAEPEPDHTGTAALTTKIDANQIDATIALAARVDELGKAMDKIRRFILGRALPGDWVRFKGPGNEAVLSMSGACAERIASALGVNFFNWSSEKEKGSDEHGEWYTWYYRGDAVIGGLTRSVEGRASTRDKFFGYANDQWKPLQDVSEPNIRIAARRSAQKEGVRQLFGLRAISESAAAGLGLDVSVVRGWEFGGKGQAGRPAGGQSSGSDGKKFSTISEPQAKRLFMMGTKDGGLAEAELKRCMSERYPYIVGDDKHPHFTKLKPEDYDAACAWAARGCQDAPAEGAAK